MLMSCKIFVYPNMAKSNTFFRLIINIILIDSQSYARNEQKPNQYVFNIKITTFCG